jgi:hypothetical protein
MHLTVLNNELHIKYLNSTVIITQDGFIMLPNFNITKEKAIQKGNNVLYVDAERNLKLT